MIQNILVAIGDTPHEQNAFEYAGHLAALLDAHLSCVYFADERHLGQEDIAARVFDNTESVLAEFEFLSAHGDTITGNPVRNLCDKAHTADLVVVGIPESIKTRGLRLIHDNIDDILSRITKPTIVVHEQCTVLQKILTIHRGDTASDHVLELAAELAKRAEASLFSLALADTQIRAAEISGQMREYLQYYQVETEFRAQLGFTVTNILNTATEEDCDLIALSASHHGRLYEMIFQDATEMVVKFADRAVLVTR
ncbi:universal stress protein [Candidatus Poribacteria bacterium]|nr:universal stress protein [Candidatus Poribacteria bacterium]